MGMLGLFTSFDQTFTVKNGSELQASNSTNGWIMYTYTDNTLRFNYNGAGGDELTMNSSGDGVMEKVLLAQSQQVLQ